MNIGTEIPNQPLEIRRGGPQDVDMIRALTREAYAQWVPVIGREPTPMAADHSVTIQDHRFDLLYMDDQLAALIETISKSDHLLIENVAVLPRFQGRGLGRLLLMHAENFALSLGYKEVRLYTNKLFEYNVNLYKKLGYQIYLEEELLGGICIHMSKAIKSI